MEPEQDDMPFVCPVAGCGARFINEDHLNWHSKKHEMSLALNMAGQSSSSPAHHNFLDQTPTPTKFLKNCEEIGLFQELTPNPFDNAYKKALDDPTAPLPGPASQGGELNTPTLILSDGNKNSPAEKSVSLSSSLPTVLLRGTEPLKPSPLTLDNSRSTLTLSHGAGQAKNLVAAGQGQIFAVAPATKIATVQPLRVQSTEPKLESSSSAVTAIQTTRFVNASVASVSSVGQVKQEVMSSDQVEGQAIEEDDKTQQQCTMQVLLQLPNGETVPISIPATINKVHYAGSTAVQQQPAPQPPQLQPKAPPAAPASQTTTIKQRLKAQLQSQLSPTAKVAAATTHDPALPGLLPEHVISPMSAFSSSPHQMAGTTPSLADSTSPVMMLDSPGSEVNLSDSSDYSVDSKRPKMSPEDCGDPEERRRKFLERNRAAAARCRQKRKHWISNLEKKADELQNTNSKLQSEVKLLRGEVTQLKTLLIAHKDCPVTQQQKSEGKLQHVMLSDPTAQVVPTATTSESTTQLGHHVVTILQPDGTLIRGEEAGAEYFRT